MTDEKQLADPIEQVASLVQMFERASRTDVTVRLEDAKALVAEVRRLREATTLRGTDAWTSLDVDGKALADARRAERERCAKAAEILVPLEQWSSEKDIHRIIASRIRALPDEP